jgi:hypothetical protein
VGKVVKVTRAQVAAAQLQRDILKARGERVDPRVEAIADASTARAVRADAGVVVELVESGSSLVKTEK